jgi:hypothetical protein
MKFFYYFQLIYVEFFEINDEHNDIQRKIFEKNLYLVHDKYVLMIVFENYFLLYYNNEINYKVLK